MLCILASKVEHRASIVPRVVHLAWSRSSGTLQLLGWGPGADRLWSWSSGAPRFWGSQALHSCETFLDASAGAGALELSGSGAGALEREGSGALRLCILVGRSSTVRLEQALWNSAVLGLGVSSCQALELECEGSGALRLCILVRRSSTPRKRKDEHGAGSNPEAAVSCRKVHHTTWNCTRFTCSAEAQKAPGNLRARTKKRLCLARGPGAPRLTNRPERGQAREEQCVAKHTKIMQTSNASKRTSRRAKSKQANKPTRKQTSK